MEAGYSLALFTALLRRRVFSGTRLQPVACVYGTASIFDPIAEY